MRIILSMPNVDFVERNDEENLPLASSQKNNNNVMHHSSSSPVSATKGMDQTMATLSLSLSMEAVEEEKEVLTVHLPPSRLVWRDDCEPPSPIRKFSAQHAPERVVVLNTRHSLLVDEESDTEAEDEDEEHRDEDMQPEDDDYDNQLIHLNFRLEMEEHARVAHDNDHLFLLPEFASVTPDREASRSVSFQEHEVVQPKGNALSTERVSLFDTVASGLVDTLCLPRKVCGASGTNLAIATNQDVYYEGALEESSLQQDILRVMGCSSPPDEDEIAHLWDLDTSLQISCNLPEESPRRLSYPVPMPPKGPHRPGPRERIMRLRQWRRERCLGTIPDMPDRTHSVDLIDLENEESKHDWDEDLTYDSDPEMSISMRMKKSPLKVTMKPPSTPKRRSCTHRWMVRESMNQNWDLVWHTEKSSVPVRAWFERGTIVGGIMLEPALVWRHSNNECTQLRFLNICRVLAATPKEQRRASILARPSCTLRLMTSTGEEFFMEAPSMARRNEIVDTWKMCIARFATLAVLEDLDNIQKEFFHAISHSFVPDVEETMDDLERDAKNDV